jgi:protein-tyrosine phosphatase
MRHATTVLGVCTGNICRSPALERLLVARIPGVQAASAGTHAVSGHPMTAQMADLVRRAGADPDGHGARQLSVDAVQQATLVLTMTREHRSAVVRLVPSAVRRTFTLLELERLTGRIDPQAVPGHTAAERVAGLAGLAAARRTPHPDRPEGDDIDDPFGGPPELYARVFTEIERAVDVLTAVAEPQPSAPSR